MKYIYILLIFVPLAILAALLGWSPILVFVSAALGIVPLAGVLGDATEDLAEVAGARWGGLLNATMGNVAELIITIFAIKQGLPELVKASITGSILGNMLLILGASVLVGGLHNGVQRFDPRQAGRNGTMSVLAVIALGIPSLFAHTIETNNRAAVEYLSLGTAAAMILVYIAGLLYTWLRPEEQDLVSEPPRTHAVRPRRALIMLLVATAFIAVLSEVLVSAVEPVVASLGVSQFFLGIVVIPLVGNAAEHLVGVTMAYKNKMELSLAISFGSSLQIALFVAPLLVFLSLLLGNPLQLVFNQFELIALVGASFIATMVAQDGESNWLEGMQLLAVYFIIALAFFFLPQIAG